MSIFSKNSGFGASKGDIKKEFMKMRDKTRSGGSHIMKESEKRHLQEDLLSIKKYGSYISLKEVDDEIQKLKKHLALARRQREGRFEVSKIQDKIDFLENLKQQ